MRLQDPLRIRLNRYTEKAAQLYREWVLNEELERFRSAIFGHSEKIRHMDDGMIQKGGMGLLAIQAPHVIQNSQRKGTGWTV